VFESYGAAEIAAAGRILRAFGDCKVTLCTSEGPCHRSGQFSVVDATLIVSARVKAEEKLTGGDSVSFLWCFTG